MTLEARSALGGFSGLARIVASFGGEETACELIERSDIGCLICTAAVDPAAHFTMVEGITGVMPPTSPGAAASRGLRRAIWMTPRSWLLLCPLGDEEELLWAFTDSFTEREIHASRYSDQLCWLELAGPGAEDLLRAGSFLSLDGSGLSVGCAKRGLLAGVAPVIYREEPSRWLLGIERNLVDYLVEWLTATASQKAATRREQ